MEKNNQTKKQAGQAVEMGNRKKSYEASFLKHHTMTRRGEKTIYIRPEYHDRISRVVQIIGSAETPLYAYLDNILKHHFELFEEEIIKDYNRKNKPIF